STSFIPATLLESILNFLFVVMRRQDSGCQTSGWKPDTMSRFSFAGCKDTSPQKTYASYSLVGSLLFFSLRRLFCVRAKTTKFVVSKDKEARGMGRESFNYFLPLLN
ncbi:hypothetical protein, partial [Neolewinella agarilytica]|uniref:hypothetical protein n=1 Tax=Neolewinella agarilytica TaxID=478744 RepID=UPI002357E178